MIAHILLVCFITIVAAVLLIMLFDYLKIDLDILVVILGTVCLFMLIFVLLPW